MYIRNFGQLAPKSLPDLNNSTFGVSMKDCDTVFEINIGQGIQHNISPSWFVGDESKCLFMNEVTMFGIDFNLDGVIAAGVIGLRFEQNSFFGHVNLVVLPSSRVPFAVCVRNFS